MQRLNLSIILATLAADMWHKILTVLIFLLACGAAAMTLPLILSASMEHMWLE